MCNAGHPHANVRSDWTRNPEKFNYLDLHVLLICMPDRETSRKRPLPASLAPSKLQNHTITHYNDAVHLPQDFWQPEPTTDQDPGPYPPESHPRPDRETSRKRPVPASLAANYLQSHTITHYNDTVHLPKDFWHPEPTTDRFWTATVASVSGVHLVYLPLACEIYHEIFSRWTKRQAHQTEPYR